MTSNAISNLTGTTYQVNAPKTQQNTEQSFSDMLRQTAPTVQSQAEGVQQTAQTTKEQPKQTDTQQADNQQTDAAKEPDTQEVQKPEKTEQVQQTEAADAEEPKQEDDNGEPDAVLLSDVMQQIMQQITEQLGVSQEDVLQAMDALGISMEDLTQNMAALLTELTGADQMAVLTDEALYTQVSDLTNAVEQTIEELADDLGMDKDRLTALLQESVKKPEEPVVMVEQELAAPVSDVQQESTGDQEVQTVVSTETETEQLRETMKQEDSDMQQQMQDMQKPAENLQQTQGSAAAAEQPTERFDLQRTQEIIDQIADYVKIHSSEKLTSMEIELNPASLGSVNLHVSSKGGVISAQLYAQDESVRAALESQVAVLKESLEAQGMKVDAIEITEHSHQLEQNLDQNGEQQERAKAQKKPARRLLNLDELPEEEVYEEEMTQAEKLQIEMMRMGGNKLNFQV
ncbi:flagellar hook-length control protein FliK [Kineothrix sp. MSJ-39]|uniref:flagellar hook-length control protein FliK n=1 Tax=Kineothrix sp. MSJ-39 TaxID=2841533 RepID=UPI001C1210B6|nr:flagellar hook-length control protein FliK [Kineothrix sp. MSJ-39]MBU5429347.1 flagellar hook-length control protein FliK [Kineothrix sp. MSJ-39]